MALASTPEEILSWRAVFVACVRVRTFERDQQRDRLHGIVTTVHVISHEEVICVRRRAADPKDLHEVMELRMDIATNDDG